MQSDWRWQSAGGLLLDGSGDIQTTDTTVPESLVDMIFTRLKADSRSWKLYDIGANLSYLVGQAITPELELKIRRQITESLTHDGLLLPGSFKVLTIPSDQAVLAIVYLADQAVATVTVPQQPGQSITVQ